MAPELDVLFKAIILWYTKTKTFEFQALELAFVMDTSNRTTRSLAKIKILDPIHNQPPSNSPADTRSAVVEN